MTEHGLRSLLVKRFKAPFHYVCDVGHHVGSANDELEGTDESDVGPCPVPRCTGVIGGAEVPWWMIQVVLKEYPDD